MLRSFILAAVLCSAASCRETPANAPEAAQETETASPTAKTITPLIDPAKLDALTGKRSANRTLRLICYHLETARLAGDNPADVIDQAQEGLGMTGTARANAVKASLVRNLDIWGFGLPPFPFPDRQSQMPGGLNSFGLVISDTYLLLLLRFEDSLIQYDDCDG